MNRALRRATGYELRRSGSAPAPQRAAARSVRAPVFVICTLRSGSTLLRMLLDSHSRVHAPHEIHLRYVTVGLNKWSQRSMRELGHDARSLEHLLWDRLLGEELARSGKDVLVEKTPNNVFIVDRLLECWPDARLLFLLRHPAMIARSRRVLRPADADDEANVELIRKYCDALEAARQRHDGLTLRYEELTADPARETRRICEFLGLTWEPGMLDYGAQEHGRLKPGLGDWADKIRTGQVQAPEPPPPDEDIPAPLRPAAVAWGYAA